MNKVKILLASLLIGFAGLASAIDVANKLVITHDNEPVLELDAKYFGVTKAELGKMAKHDAKFVADATRIANGKKQGTYAISLLSAMTEDGKLLAAPAPILFEKLTLKEVNKIMRVNQNYSNALVADSELQDAKGKKAWGNK